MDVEVTEIWLISTIITQLISRRYDFFGIIGSANSEESIILFQSKDKINQRNFFLGTKCFSEKLPNCGWDQFIKFKKGKYGFFLIKTHIGSRTDKGQMDEIRKRN